MREDWKEVRIKDVAKNIGSGSTPSSDNEPFYDNGTIPWINTGDLNDNFITENKKNITDLAYASYPILRYFYPETVIIALYGATIGKLGILTYKATVNQACCCITLFNNYYYKYLFYYLSYSKDEILKNSFGGTQPNISQKTVANILVYLPPLPVQHAIANYLDKKLGVIDKHISLLENKRDTYKRLRKNLINQTVRRGLSPLSFGEGQGERLQDSGIEWLGKIPKHWEVKRVKDVTMIKKGKLLETVEEQLPNYKPLLSLDYLRNDAPQFDNFVFTDDKELHVTENELIVVWDGAGSGDILKGKEGILSSTIAKISMNEKKILTKFFYHLRYNLEYKLKSLPTGMGIPHINSNVLKEFQVPIPPLSEQQAIADYLDTKTQKIDNILENINGQLGKLAQLKKSLINETVTGNRNI